MIRSTVLRRWLVTASAVALASTTAGCAGTDGSAGGSSAPGAVAIVVGAHGNMPQPVLSGRAARARDLAAAQNSYFSVFVADGAPYEVAHDTLVPAGDVTGEGGDRETLADRVDATVAEARARNAEVDLLTAIDLAARDLADQPGLHTVVVVDSGLATAGPLNFLEPGLLDAEPQEVADTLDDLGLLPDLGGDTVVFQGLGDTTAPQQPLDRARRTQLQAIWTAVAKAAGAVSVEVEHSPLRGDPVADVPPVTPVPMGPGYSCADGIVTLDGGVISFQPDSDVFLDQEAAEEVLRPLAEQIVTQRLKAVLFGASDSAGDLESQKKRSGLRAQHVADTFIKMGVPIPQLAVEGLGSDFPGFVPDQDAAGHLMPAAAALNRKVIIHLETPNGRAPCL